MTRRPLPALRTLGLVLLGLALFATAANAQDHWPRFRGPDGNGRSDATTIPTQWTEADYNWTVDLPGEGHASPVIWGDRIFLTATEPREERWLMLCIDADSGEILWQQSERLPRYRQHRYNSFAAATPAVDEHHVYAVNSTPETYELFALDHAGNEVWRRNLGGFEAMHGSGASPIVHDDLVILPNDQQGESFIIAVDRMTGQLRWEMGRRSGKTAYSTPGIYRPEDGDPQLLLTSNAHGITGVDPETGDLLWELSDVFNLRTVASPIMAGGLVIGSCGWGGGTNTLVAARPGEVETNGAEAAVAYSMEKGAPYVPTPVAVGDLLFLVSDAGIATCLHAPTGEVKWRKRLDGNFFSSPVAVDGKIYCVKRRGEVVVFRAADEFERLAVNPLGEQSHATPAVAHGRMYLRTVGQLISLGGSDKE